MFKLYDVVTITYCKYIIRYCSILECNSYIYRNDSSMLECNSYN